MDEAISSDRSGRDEDDHHDPAQDRRPQARKERRQDGEGDHAHCETDKTRPDDSGAGREGEPRGGEA